MQHFGCSFVVVGHVFFIDLGPWWWVACSQIQVCSSGLHILRRYGFGWWVTCSQIWVHGGGRIMQLQVELVGLGSSSSMESLLLSFPLATKMFSCLSMDSATVQKVDLYRKSSYLCLFSSPQSILSLTMPFLVSRCLGIYHKLTDSLSTY